MDSPLRVVHVQLDSAHVTHLRLKAARRHLSMSALLRELVDRDIERDARARRRADERAE